MWLSGNEPACQCGDSGSTSGAGRSPGEGNGNPLQYSYLRNLLWTEDPGGLQPMGSENLPTYNTAQFKKKQQQQPYIMRESSSSRIFRERNDLWTFSKNKLKENLKK